MKQILISTHGKMASCIRYTAELIVGKMAEITTIDAYVTPEDNVEKKFEEYFAQHENDRIFVFTDLMGGSVNQKLLGYSQKENVTLITGTNLPVLMQVMMADDDVTEEEIQEFIDDAREELQVVDLGGEKKSPAKENAAPAAEKSAPKKAPAPQSYDNSTAKITALRVDDRLIHGQVAMTWTKQLAVQGIVVANAKSLLRNILDSADEAIRKGGIAATLSFGHDGNVIPLVALMQIENCNVAVNDPYEVYKVWSDFKVVPMAANVQIIFFRNEKSDDILVKIMHNENEVHIPVQTDMFPYYKWRDVENYYRGMLQ